MKTYTPVKCLLILSLFSIQTSYSQLPANLQKGLLAYYAFDGNVTDSSTYSYNGTIVGTVHYVKDHSGVENSSLQLGTGRVVTSSFFNFQYTDTFSVSFWMRIDDNSSNGRLFSTECPDGAFRVSSYGNGSMPGNWTRTTL